MAKLRLDFPLSAGQLGSLLHYQPTTGALIWKERPNVVAQWNTRFAGKRAGSLTKEGYVQITINGWVYRAHRVAYLLKTGAWPTVELDHRDGNRSNNKWRNLPLPLAPNRCGTPS